MLKLSLCSRYRVLDPNLAKNRNRHSGHKAQFSEALEPDLGSTSGSGLNNSDLDSKSVLNLWLLKIWRKNVNSGSAVSILYVQKVLTISKSLQ